MRRLIAVTMAVLAISCGNYRPEPGPQDTTKDASTAAATNDAGTSAATPSSKSTLVRGYISGAFDITVNDTPYSSSEDFFTQQLIKLQAQAAQDGYANWSLSFSGQLGYNDFASNMRAFASSEAPGFASATAVNSDGSFGFNPPAEVVNLRILVEKRLSVTLTPPSKGPTQVTWCLTLSADQSLDLVQTRSVSLTSFKTTLTKYHCQDQGGNGFAVPAIAALAAGT